LQSEERPLSAKERLFVEKYMELGGGKGAGTPAALAAGFKPSYAMWAAHRMLRRPIVARVIEERQRARVRLLAPKAIDVVEEILDDKNHKDRLKAANQVLNRTDPVVVGVAHQHDVHVSVLDNEMGVLALRWLRELGASRAMLEEALGVNALPELEAQLDDRPKPVMIEGEVLEADPDDNEDDDE
jgi:hypothetical protein